MDGLDAYKLAPYEDWPSDSWPSDSWPDVSDSGECHRSHVEGCGVLDWYDLEDDGPDEAA